MRATTEVYESDITKGVQLRVKLLILKHSKILHA